MRMRFKTVKAEKVFPVLGIFDPVIVSKKGVLTVGWEITYPTAYNATESEYDEILSNFAAATRVLPEWSIIHRQDVYLYDRYSAEEPSRGFLDESYNRHHEGRRYLTHRSYIFVSIAKRGHIDKGGRYSGLFGINAKVEAPSPAVYKAFLSKCDEFIAILLNGKYIAARRLERRDWIGEGRDVGILQKYMMLGDESPLMSDIALSPDSVRVHDNVMQAFVIGESDCLPNEIESVSKVAELSSLSNEVTLSYGSKLGVLFDCEHIVNEYVVVPPQAEVHRQLEKERNKMVSGIKSTDNRLNSAEITDYLDDVYKYGLFTVRSHVNVLAWGPEEDTQAIRAKLSAALNAMNMKATYNIYNTPVLYYAGIPSNGFEISKENLMTQELCAVLAISPYETFERGIPGGIFKICDRMRNVPVEIDTQMKAAELGYITNYNAFVLGGSGSGKSFFMNSYLRNCYDSGEHVFVIDVGDSYEGLCSIINEQTQGRDGAYLSWDKDHPFSFNPFIGIEDWVNSSTGSLDTDENGLNFFVSFLQAIWSPKGGWTASHKSILMQIVADFTHYALGTGRKDLILDDFYRFVDREIAGRIRYASATLNADGTPRDQDAVDEDNCRNGYFIGSIQVTEDRFDVADFILSLKEYSKDGSFGFLLNDPAPKDLFTSRFTVFEVDKLSSVSDPTFYSICILCIMNAFERKMRNTSGFKNMVIEEAWKAIANDTFLPYIKGIWKTARKFSCAAIVVTQELADITGSSALKTAIIDNSDVKILLDQSNHLNTFDIIQEALSLTDIQRNLVLSLNRSNNPNYRYREVFISLGGKKCFVGAVEVSPEEALAYESNKNKKAEMLSLAAGNGIITAIRQLVERLKRRAA